MLFGTQLGIDIGQGVLEGNRDAGAAGGTDDVVDAHGGDVIGNGSAVVERRGADGKIGIAHVGAGGVVLPKREITRRIEQRARPRAVDHGAAVLKDDDVAIALDLRWGITQERGLCRGGRDSQDDFTRIGRAG